MERNQINRLVYSSGEQGGFLLWAILLVFILVWRAYRPKTAVPKLQMNHAQVEAWRCALEASADSLKLVKTTIRPFNPNFINGARAMKLELSSTQHNRLQQYRQSGKWINSQKDFQSVTGVSPAWMRQYGALFVFPDFIRKRQITGPDVRAILTRNDLNQASDTSLRRINGIGAVLSQRIIDWRERHGDYRRWEELRLIYGLNEGLIDELKKRFYLDTSTAITQQNINRLSVSDLAVIPGVSFDVARSIWEFVRLRQGLDSIAELSKIDKVTPQIFGVIQLYLFATKN